MSEWERGGREQNRSESDSLSSQFAPSIDLPSSEGGSKQRRRRRSRQAASPSKTIHSQKASSCKLLPRGDRDFAWQVGKSIYEFLFDQVDR